MGTMSVLALAVLSLVLFVCGIGAAKELKRDPATGRIRILYIGAPFKPGPYHFFRLDPLLSTTPVQADLYGGLDVVERSMRIYMPRSREHLISGYDVVGMDDGCSSVFRSQTIQWMVDGCIIDGLGLFMGGGFESFGGAAEFPSWGETVLDHVMPVQCTDEYGNDGRNVVTDFEDDLIRSIPWDEYGNHRVFAGYNIVTRKEGSHQLSTMVRLWCPGKDPGWVWWDIGKGRFFASAPGLRGGSAWKSFIWWEYYPDFVGNLAYFVAGLLPPSDLELLHSVRKRFIDCSYEKEVVVSTIGFIAKYGADTTKVDEKLLEAEEVMADARRSYVDLDLEQSKERADRVFDMLEEAYKLSIDAKKTALYWIFITEWLVVTAAGLGCGFVVWTLMVRRMLYREVGVTRGGERSWIVQRTKDKG